MTPEDRAARKALLSLARWAQRQVVACGCVVESDGSFGCCPVCAGVEKVAHEAERRARRIGR